MISNFYENATQVLNVRLKCSNPACGFENDSLATTDKNSLPKPIQNQFAAVRKKVMLLDPAVYE